MALTSPLHRKMKKKNWKPLKKKISYNIDLGLTTKITSDIFV